jgi:AMMECR1 domain-containing protein
MEVNFTDQCHIMLQVGSVGKHGVELAENNGSSSFLPIVAISRVLVQQTPNSKSFLLSYAVPCTLL